MSAADDDYRKALDRARVHSLEWLASMPTRPVRPRRTADEIEAEFPARLDDAPRDAADVVDELARVAEPGLMAMPSGRFFGWVIGGTLPAALAADWLVGAWDQNAALRYATPATAALEEVAGRWVLDLLGLPTASGVGFTTGGTTANFVGLAAGRRWVLDRAGWNVDAEGLSGAPRVRVFVGAERHASVDIALRYLGLGRPTVVAADAQGRLRADELAAALAETDASEGVERGHGGPRIVVLQAGDLHSGAFDPLRESIAIARRHGAWVHVDGAFGLWAAASPTLRGTLLDGVELADSWATDAHKTLNVPYDCGIAIVGRADLLRAVFTMETSYLVHEGVGVSDPFERVPELSRRARGVPVWAALRSLGRDGVVDLVERLVATARHLAEALGRLPGVEVLNDVVFTQVCVSFGSDERTRAVTQALIAEGEVWMSGSRWSGRDVLRISVSNWSTDARDVQLSISAVERALDSVPIAP
ncbi:pyridoxal-dependent decarboxylase [Herbiconiux sp. CPCC 205763]|uniref:Pyridoxal-dependent decarboxylase n=1 Tax=Herbiconiux aconitum TaxID=2970913 RepID=A0ABT2GNN3_9MICO|nr:pyridoxal-dependent decarboxylase [Herbiconiux aconitum]MCS5717824.1 pyridoxal-dependent decarboxylase [Herbiconiux aconitum]